MCAYVCVRVCVYVCVCVCVCVCVKISRRRLVWAMCVRVFGRRQAAKSFKCSGQQQGDGEEQSERV